MNYSTDEHEYLDWVEQSNTENKYNPCDIHYGAYMLVDEASPDALPRYFTTLDGAVSWAKNDKQYASYQGVEQWSVYQVGNKVM